MKNVSMKGLLLMLALLSVGCQRRALYLADPSVQLQLRVHAAARGSCALG